jgi:hypothetical protein
MPITPPGADRVTAISIDVIPHTLQRYDTCGDYVYDATDGTLAITVSATGDWRESMAVAVHELVEALLAVQRGVSIAAIDAWDKVHDGDADEPGEMAGAPYYDEHLTATVVERLLAHELGLHWPAYEDDIYALSAHYSAAVRDGATDPTGA